MILELLALAGLFAGTQAIAHNGHSSNRSNDESKKENTDIDLPSFNSDLFKPGNHLTHTRYWENSDTGDYIRYKIDIDIDD